MEKMQRTISSTDASKSKFNAYVRDVGKSLYGLVNEFHA